MKKRTWALMGAASFWLTWPLLYFYLRNSHRTRVLLVCGDEALLVRNWVSTGRWTLTGGGVHAGEASQAAAVREVKEEIGVTLSQDQLVSLGGYHNKLQGFRFSADLYGVRLTHKPKLRLQTKEIVEAQWFPLTKLKDHWCTPEVDEAVTAWSKL
jgi:8-oxo-dGTP pyrophosphatase MutT (NUDIX family)